MNTSTAPRDDGNSRFVIHTRLVARLRRFIPGHEDAGSVFPLARYFALTSFLAFLLAATAVTMETFHFARSTLVDTQESLNTTFALALANELFQGKSDRIQDIANLPAWDPLSAPLPDPIQLLDNDVRRVVAGTSIFKVKIYNRQRQTVYSTEHSQIGELADSAGVTSALRGVAVSELVHRDTFSSLEGVVMNRDLVQSYIPFQVESAHGKEVWAYEVYSDVTAILDRNQAAYTHIAMTTIGLLAVLFLVLHAIVIRADHIIRRQALDKSATELSIRAREAALESERHQFFAAAAHELRTPMTVIQGFAELLRNRTMNRADFDESLDLILAQSTSMLSLLDDILELTSLDEIAHLSLRLEWQDIRIIVQEALRRIAAPESAGRLKMSACDHACYASVDTERFMQAVVNIASNALKYSPSGTPVEIHVSTTGPGPDRRVTVMVRDQGIGMSAEEISQVFKRFWRSDRVKSIKGTGLGMSIVRSTLERHCGGIDISSTPDKGTTVTLWLPGGAKREENT